ncbi:hypothetical protein DID75_00460 [Candidatus Marinamargulisbacteria bacterium SCGC AG-410-N11]|nr:hypothetical protein DID75_00460 [Candidatus Marinamargulisbacteria bacterium SCGC AG-410-N11]
MFKNKLPKSLTLIQYHVVKCVLIAWCFFSVVALFINKFWILSALLGAITSFIIFNQLMNSQFSILQNKKNSLFFIHYLSRLAIYAIPIIIFFCFKEKLNLIVIVLFLFSFQVSYIVFELTKNIKRYKRRKLKWKN